MTINLRFTPKDWERIQRDWTAWWHHEIDRPMTVINAYEWQGINFIPQFGGWDIEKDIFPVDQVLDYHQQNLENEPYLGDSWPRWWPNFGAGIVAAFLGAKVGVDENTVWFEPPANAQAADIDPKFDAGNYWWRWVTAITKSAVNRWGNQVTVAHTDLGGNLDILASLRGTQNLLLDLHDCPEEVARLASEITQLWLRYYDDLYAIIQTAGRGTTAWTPMFCPGRYYMLQSDFCYMISPEMFERFVMPDLETICSHLDYGFYHLDGKGQIPHLELLLSIQNLRGVQWVPGDGQPPTWEWLPLLKRIRDAGKLCQIYASAEGALTVTRELGGKGFMFWLTDPLTEMEAQDFLKALELENKT
jgi:5-methyltetrahydrofolate--homocysteine methyltransferase